MKEMKKLILFTWFVGALISCDTDLEPLTSETPDTTFSRPNSYKSFAAKIYAGYAVTGQEGPFGNPDIVGFEDEGFTDYIRQYWQLQELSTEEAIIGWNDPGLQDLNAHIWTPSNAFIGILYNRIYFQIALANEFIKQSADGLLSQRGIEGTTKEEIQFFRSEVRFLRALSYWHAIDLYGNAPLVTEEQELGAFLPKQGSRQQLFDYVVNELNAILPSLKDMGTNQYGRADKGAALALLAKLYMNARVYIEKDMSSEALLVINQLLEGPYQLHDNYSELFLADNDSNGAQNEIIFPIAFDGVNTQGFGGMTFLVHAPVGGNQIVADFGIDSGWEGLRTTSTFVDYFLDISGNTDKRASFFTDGQMLNISTISNFSEGYLIEKFSNVTSDGALGSDPQLVHADTDFPVFRLADIYLMYAEAVLRGGTGGNLPKALELVNNIRERAYGNTINNITNTQLTLDFLLDERARELHWEGHRRTDLIRFEKYNSLLWAFKKELIQGGTSEAFRSLYPIPFADIVANPNLKQNFGY